MKGRNWLSRNIGPLTEINTNKFYKSVTKESERTKAALASYILYFNGNDKYKIDESYDCLTYNDKIRIHADLLTNTKPIMKMAEKFNLQDDCVINAFNNVAYTIGNCCPTFKNPASGNGFNNDTIWYKLRMHIIEERDRKKTPIKWSDRPDLDLIIKDLRKRNSNKYPQMFSIFGENITWETLISDLYLQDYFDCDWNLLDEKLPKKYDNIKELNKDDFLQYVLRSTILIVQRGYRIAAGYKGNILTQEDQKIIKKYLEQVGLHDPVCIYSKKRNIECLVKLGGTS